MRPSFVLSSVLILVPSLATAQTTDPAPPASEPAPTEPSEPARPSASAEALAPPAPAPVAPPPEEETRVTFEARAGRGFTVRYGNNYSLNIRPRIQLRDTVTFPDGDHPTNDVQVRTMRLWLTGNVLNPAIRYGIQLAMGANDLTDTGSTSPIFDAFLDFRRNRDLSVKVGQYFVPFDRMRTVREVALETVDRSVVVSQLTLDRDVGVTLYSEDLGGHGGRYGYQLGFFGGEGRNRFEPRVVGFLYTARFTYKPFGAFDDDSEGDLERRHDPKLAIGVAGAIDHNAVRARATTGNFLTLGSMDTFHGALDLAFKWRGFAFLGEVVVRGSTTPTRTGTVMGAATTQVAPRALGYVFQASYLTPWKLAFYARWGEVRRPWTTDAATQTLVGTRGRELAGGLDVYLNGHQFKFQLDAVHTFGADFQVGATQLRVQLDASF